MLADPQRSLPPTLSHERRRFQIHSCLGRGGFGEVYRATMESTGGVTTEVAVKVLRADIDPGSEAVKRLRDEGRLLGKLSHPAILKVHDLVLLDGRVALVTEYIEGEDLDGCMHGSSGGSSPSGSSVGGSSPASGLRMPLRPLVTAIGEVASALDAAWRSPSQTTGEPLHLIHRDVKPANVRLGRHGEVKLLDFGIARATNVVREAQTAHDSMMGSYPYMAPERFHEEAVEPPSDVFALGCILFEGISGARFYGDYTLKQVYATVLSPNKYRRLLEERLATIAGATPPSVMAFLGDLLAPDAAQRPDAAAVARRCEDFAEELEGVALKRWCRDRVWPAQEPINGSLDGKAITAGSFFDATSQPALERAQAPGTSAPQAAWGGMLPEMDAPPRVPLGAEPPVRHGAIPNAPPPPPGVVSVQPESPRLPSRPPAPRPQPVPVATPAPASRRSDLGIDGPGLGGFGSVDVSFENEPALALGSTTAADDAGFEQLMASSRRRRRIQAFVVASIFVVALAMVVVVPASYFAAKMLAAPGVRPVSPITAVDRVAPSTEEPISSDAVAPEAVEPEAVEPDVAEPEPVEPVEPEAVEPEAVEPEAAEPEAIQPAPAPAAQPAPAPAGPTPSSLSGKGWQAVSSDAAVAADLFRQALALQPGYADAEYGLGYVLLQGGNGEEAKPHLCRALASGGTDTQRDVSSLMARNGLSCD